MADFLIIKDEKSFSINKLLLLVLDVIKQSLEARLSLSKTSFVLEVGLHHKIRKHKIRKAKI